MGNDSVRVLLETRHFKADINIFGLRKMRALAEDPDTGKYLEVLMQEKIQLGLMEFNIMAAITEANDRDKLYELREKLNQSHEDRMKIIREFTSIETGGPHEVHE